MYWPRLILCLRWWKKKPRAAGRACCRKPSPSLACLARRGWCLCSFSTSLRGLSFDRSHGVRHRSDGGAFAADHAATAGRSPMDRIGWHGDGCGFGRVGASSSAPTLSQRLSGARPRCRHARAVPAQPPALDPRLLLTECRAREAATLPVATAVCTLAAVALLLPVMLVFPSARPLIAFSSMAIGAGLLLWRAADQRPKR